MLNGLSVGLLLFMLVAGLTLIFSRMGVLNFAHASFNMLGAYVACPLSRFADFWRAPAQALADRCLVMGHGRIVFDGTPDAPRGRAGIRRESPEV